MRSSRRHSAAAAADGRDGEFSRLYRDTQLFNCELGALKRDAELVENVAAPKVQMG